MPTDISMQIAAVIVLFDTSYKLFEIINNFISADGFDPKRPTGDTYSGFYLVFCLPMLLAALFAVYYLCGGRKRKAGVWAVVFAGASNIIVGIWVLIYFFAINDQEQVRYHWGTLADINAHEDPQDREFLFQDKDLYAYANAFPAFGLAIIYAIVLVMLLCCKGEAAPSEEVLNDD